MSYRSSINRALGETSLELKCLLLFGISLLPVFVVSFLLYWRVTEQVVYKPNAPTALLLVQQALLTRHSEVFETDRQPQPWSEREKDFFADIFKPVVQDIAKQTYTQKWKWEFIDNREGASRSGVDAEESEIIGELLQSGAEAKPDETNFRERLVSSRSEYHYYQPIRLQQSCVDCHKAMPGPAFDAAALGLSITSHSPQAGDIMGVMKVIISSEQIQADVNYYWNLLLAASIITAFLAIVAFYFTIRYVIVRPLRHLRNVSDAISHGNISLRADIHTGDEFESLSMAFNRMLGHLVTVQEELRQVNTSLDAKVDELAQANMQLYEMNRVKSDFLATMSHELRTPLNSILGFSDVLGSISSLEDKQKRYVEHIRKSGRMLLDMINNILDLAKMESGKMEVRLTDFHIGHVIEAQCDMARPLSEKKNIDLDCEIDPELPMMRQDQARVQQILNNLLSNAIKFTPEGGRVKIVARMNASGDLVLQVSDTGVGIAEEDQQTIFEKFRQGRTAMPGGDAMTREYSGTGLGLSIVRELCRLLGGEITVQSQLGTGSVFTVRLPFSLDRQPRLDDVLGDGFDEAGASRAERLRDGRTVAAAGMRAPGGSSE